jgi:hypothetical protein
MRTRPVVIACLLVAIVLTIAGCAGRTAGASGTAGAGATASSIAAGDRDVAVLISTTCSRCHPLARVKAADHDAAGWAVTITRMRQVHHAPIDDAQAKQIIDFLGRGRASQL